MNIFCANCENECSESATACPKCGHPLGVAAKDALTDHDIERIRLAILETKLTGRRFNVIFDVVWRAIGAVLIVPASLAGLLFLIVLVAGACESVFRRR